MNDTSGAVDLHGRPPRPFLDEPLRFTDHAIVRFIERHVDEAAVRALRRQGLDEHRVAASLRVTHAHAIDDLVGRARRAFDGRSSQFRNVVCGLTYAIVLAHVPLVIAGDACVTVLPPRREVHRRAA